MRRVRTKTLLAIALLPLALSSCAYYNTFYLARRYYLRGTEGLPYPVEKPNPAAAQNFTRAVDYSKKLIGNYPKSKWVDDAYLMWARALLGREDPLQTVTMLQDFATRYPKSPLKDEAMFYLGVGYRHARKYKDALQQLDEFLAKEPKHSLVPYALLERSRTLMALERPAEAAETASQVIERHSRSKLVDRARVARAEALVANGEYPHARADYHELGAHARTDEERFSYLLKEADALEAGRSWDAELVLLQDALSHEPEPALADTSVQGIAPGIPQVPGADRWARLQLRIGSVHMLKNDKEPALAAYRRVIRSFPRTPLAAEAQYRIGFLFETVADDFESAREEYKRVQSHAASGAFTTQAATRLANLERLAQYRSAGGDSLNRKIEASFLLAELYLLQLDKPDRALTEYRKIALEHPGTAQAGKAMIAEAWVLRHKYKREVEPDSVLWEVVKHYPATEAQIAARDYLEARGQSVPDSLIRYPETPVAPADTTLHLTPPPEGSMPLGSAPGSPDSLGRLGLPRERGLYSLPDWDQRIFGPPAPYPFAPPGLGPFAPPGPFTPPDRPASGADSSGAYGPPAPVIGPADTTMGASPPVRRAPPDSTSKRP